MMKALPLLLLVLLHAAGAQAQTKGTIVIKAGSNMADVLTPADLYRYPQFVEGRVYYREGASAKASMNYSKTSDEILFINPKNDTLALTNEKTIRYVVMNADTFYYDRGYVQLVAGSKNAKLASKQRLKVADKQKIGGYGMPTSTSAIDNYNSYNDGVQTHKLNVREDLLLVSVTQFYFGDQNNHFLPANKKSLQLLYPKQKKGIDQYLKANAVDFDKQEDLQKLVYYIGQL